MSDKEKKYNPDDNAGVIAFPPFIYIGFLIAGFLLGLFIPLEAFNGLLSFVLGASFTLLGFFFVISAFRLFKKKGTNIPPTLPATVIVSTGLYKVTRNPMYLGMMLIYLGVGVYMNSLWILILSVPLFIVINKGVVDREESYLENKFGKTYLDYKSSVRRWL